MSKKSSNVKTDSLDAELIGVEKAPKQKTAQGEVSLLEYSKSAPFSFNSLNYRILFVGLAVNILGFLLMIGGGSDNPANFDAGELFSHVRITLAPALIVLGYGIIAYSIMRKPKANKE